MESNAAGEPPVWSHVGMFLQGILIFGIAGVVVIIAYVAMVSNRRREQDDLPPEDRLSDEEFRRVEYGDDD